MSIRVVVKPRCPSQVEHLHRVLRPLVRKKVKPVLVESCCGWEGEFSNAIILLLDFPLLQLPVTFQRLT